MAINVSFVQTIAPEFASLASPTIQFFIDQAVPFINFTLWDDKADLAHAYFTAHLMKMSGINGSGAAGGGSLPGPITSETTGDLSRSYGSSGGSGASASSLNSTGYGTIFLSLMKTVQVSPMVVSDMVLVVT